MSNKPETDLQRQIREMREKMAAMDALDAAAKAGKAATETVDNAKAFFGFVGRVRKTWAVANENVFKPVGKILRPFLGWAWDSYRWGWNKFCYPTQPFHKSVLGMIKAPFLSMKNILSTAPKEQKEPEEVEQRGPFKPHRAAIAAAFTALALVPGLRQVPVVGAFIPDVFNTVAIGLIYEPPYDTARMLGNAMLHGGEIRTEKLFLNGRTEIDPENNVWSSGGCDEKPDCKPEDAVYFRIKPSLAHMAWSLATKATPFLADDVANAIPQVPSACVVKSYGSRWRASKYIESYPVMIDVQCQALSNIQPR